MSKRAHPFDHSAVAEISAPATSRYAAEISAYTANQRKREQRANAAQAEVVGPTPERLAKAAYYDEILVPVKDDTTRATHRVSRVRTSFEALADKLSEEDMQALARWVKTYFDAQAGRSVISGYGEGGGTAYGPRSGGVPDHARAAHNECVALAAYMGGEAYTLFVSLCCELLERHRAGVSTAALYGNPYKGAQADRIFQAGMLRVLGMLVRWYEQRQRGLERRERSATEIAASRQARREREWGRK